jgi:tetratricopeptide (TPR) repeat protein
LVELAPKRAAGWLHHAYAVRRAVDGGVEKALDALLPAVDRFPTEPYIPYNLACYAAQFGRLDEAWEWLHKAMEAEGDVNRIKTMALQDADLKALWERISEL